MLHSVVYPRIPARPKIVRSRSLLPMLRLTPLFRSSSALFFAMAHYQLSCFQSFAHSFPSHGGVPKHGWSARSMLRFGSPTSGTGDASPACLYSLDERPQRPIKDSQQGPLLMDLPSRTCNTERRTSRSDELTNTESYSCIKPPGVGQRATIQRRRHASASDSFCHFKKSSPASSMCCALFDKNIGGGVPRANFRRKSILLPRFRAHLLFPPTGPTMKVQSSAPRGNHA